MKNPRYRNSQPPPQRSDVLASPPPSLHPKGENSLKETVMVAALSLWCILRYWVHLIRLNFQIWNSILDDWVDLCINFEMWCRKYRKTYPSVKEKLYRFMIFKKEFKRTGSMPNGYGDLTEDELEDCLRFGSYDDDDSEEEFFKSLNKRVGNTYRIYEENNQVLVDCSGPNTFRDSDIEEEKLFERLRRNPGSTYQVFNDGTVRDQEEVAVIEKDTYRLAVVNMDWNYVKAVDLYVVFNSFVPTNGMIKSVAFYPTGLQRMKEEDIRGPVLSDIEDEKSDEDDNEKLCAYQNNNKIDLCGDTLHDVPNKL